MFAEADISMTQMALEGSRSLDRNRDALRIQFFMKPRLDQAASDKENRPIYTDTVYIRKMTPGSRDVIERPLYEKDKFEFAQQYAAFMNGKNQDEASGTPLSMWPDITPSQVEELKHFHVVTMEQLAQMPDNLVQKFMGMQSLKQKAQTFIDAAKTGAPLKAIHDELEAMKLENKRLAAVVAELSSPNTKRGGKLNGQD